MYNLLATAATWRIVNVWPPTSIFEVVLVSSVIGEFQFVCGYGGIVVAVSGFRSCYLAFERIEISVTVDEIFLIFRIF